MPDTMQPMTNAEVVAALQDAYCQLDALLERLDEAAMIEPGIFDDWTVKDVLAHLAAWEQLELGWMEAVLRSETPLLYAPGYERDETDWRMRIDAIERFNARVLEESRTCPLKEVLTEFRVTQMAMLDLVRQLPERALTDPSVFFWLADEVERETWTPIPVNSYEHYFQHIGPVRAWTERYWV